MSIPVLRDRLGHIPLAGTVTAHIEEGVGVRPAKIATQCVVILDGQEGASQMAEVRGVKMGVSTTAALIVNGFTAIPLVTIGVTNADVTSNNDADNGAGDQGMDCT